MEKSRTVHLQKETNVDKKIRKRHEKLQYIGECLGWNERDSFPNMI